MKRWTIMLALDPRRRKLIFNVSTAFLVAGFTYYVTGLLPVGLFEIWCGELLIFQDNYGAGDFRVLPV